jgi:hypothetical protein
MDLPNPWIALGVVASTAATDAVFVMFNGAVSAWRPSKSRELEQRLVSALGVCRDQLHEKSALSCLPRVARGWARSARLPGSTAAVHAMPG